MKKILFITLMFFSLTGTAQNFLSFGGAIILPKTDTDIESGASLSASFNHILGPVFGQNIILQPIVAISMMSGTDNEIRRNRQYSYNVEMVSIGTNISTTGKFYGILGLHLNANTLSNKFRLKPNMFDKTSKNNMFMSEYVGIGYRTTINIELGLMYNNTNYLEGYFPITSKHNDMYMQLKFSYDLPLNGKCRCERRNYY